MNALDQLNAYLRRLESRLRLLAFSKGTSLVAVSALPGRANPACPASIISRPIHSRRDSIICPLAGLVLLPGALVCLRW